MDKDTVMFRNKRSQAKGVHYVFLYKQHLDNVSTRVVIHRFTLGSLVVGRSLSSLPQSWISTLAREYQVNLTLWLTGAEPTFSPYHCSPSRFFFSLALFPLDWQSFSFLDSLDGVYKGRLTLSESEYCPTSFPTVYPKVPYK